MEFYAMEPELSRRDCGLVMDLLDMFRILKYSVEQNPGVLSDNEVRALTFRGFDLNDEFEGRLLGYARWLVSEEDRWHEQSDTFSELNDRGNSHMPWLAAYQRMLKVYEPIWRGVLRRGGRSFLLDIDELREVAAAATHPSHRPGT